MRGVLMALAISGMLVAGDDDGQVDSCEVIETCQKIEAHPHFRMVRNILTVNPIGNASRNWDCLRNFDFTFSNEIDPQLPVTNQKRTGRCWMFAALNQLRIPLCSEHALYDFEFSQSYLFFFDKIEKANFFLEQMIRLGVERKDGELLRFFISNPMPDGNFWQSFASLVQKYGLVPKKVYPESSVCFQSDAINRILSMKLLQGAEKIRNLLAEGGTIEQARELKSATMKDVYKILVVHMGTPPTEFSWTYYDMTGKYHAHKKLTPHSFFKKFVDVDLDSYVILVHSPQKKTPYYENYSMNYSNSVIGGKNYTGLNVPIEVMKEITQKVIVEEKDPVVFAADVFFADPETGIMDPSLFELSELYQVDFSMTKESRMEYDLSLPNHQMLFTGVDIEDGKPKKWKVENSWGDGVGVGGYFVMMDSWFDEYVFEAIVPKQALPESLRRCAEKKPIEIDPWDFWEKAR